MQLANRGVRLFISGRNLSLIRLRELSPKVQRKVLNQALRAGAKIILKEARSNAPVYAGPDPRAVKGAVKDSIRVRAAAKRKRGQAFIECRVGEGDFKGSTWYAAAVEYGTSKMAPRPFMTPAFEAKGAEAKAIVMRRIVEGVEREASRS